MYLVYTFFLVNVHCVLLETHASVGCHRRFFSTFSVLSFKITSYFALNNNFKLKKCKLRFSKIWFPAFIQSPILLALIGSWWFPRKFLMFKKGRNSSSLFLFIIFKISHQFQIWIQNSLQEFLDQTTDSKTSSGCPHFEFQSTNTTDQKNTFENDGQLPSRRHK